MSAKRDEKTGKWNIQYRYKDWQGNNRKSTKRGFNTKREAEQWLRNFLACKQSDVNMAFGEFVNIYLEDISTRVRKTTINTKKNIFEKKILPYFSDKPLSSITAVDVRKWQNIILSQNYSPTYLRSIHSQLSAVFKQSL